MNTLEYFLAYMWTLLKSGQAVCLTCGEIMDRQEIRQHMINHLEWSEDIGG